MIPNRDACFTKPGRDILSQAKALLPHIIDITSLPFF
jgi:hypothetical protein